MSAHQDDEARIAEWETGARYVECEDPKAPPAADVRALGYFLVRSEVDEAVALMREFAARPKVVTRHKVTQTGEHFCQTQCEERKALAAGKAKAEAEVERLRADRSIRDAEADGRRISDLRAKLAEAEKQRDAAVLAAKNAAELMMVANTEAVRYMRERDAALRAAKPERCSQCGACSDKEAETKCRAAQDVTGEYWCPGSELWDETVASLRAAKPEPANYADSKFGPWPGDAKPEPAAEPVPAAADAKPGDEVLREFLRSHATDSYSSDIELMADTVAWLCRRALEVRP